MISLLDVDVLVALFDPAHVHHDAAHDWFGAHRSRGWATCALTENGLVSAVSHPEYPGRRTTVADAFDRLRVFTESGDHHFWPGSASLRRESRVDTGRLEGHHQVAQAYLLLLAVENGGRLVTLTGPVPVAAVRQARPEQAITLA